MKLFYEKYIKLAHIGKGANAHVYKVKHADLGYVRAIKVLNDDIENESDKVYQSFLKECRTLLAIGNGCHPNIVRIYGPSLVDNHAIVEMDYIQGSTLDSYVRQKGFIEFEEVSRFIHDIVGALAYTHHDIYAFLMDADQDNLTMDPLNGQRYDISPAKERELVKKYGISHNDLHSNNVMRRDYDGSFVLLDFGLAVQGGRCVKSSKMDNGSPEYLAPEKFDSDVVSPRSDIYSVGILMYEVLAGRVPFPVILDVNGRVSQGAINTVLTQHQSAIPEPIEGLRKRAFERKYPGQTYKRDYPQWLDTVVMKCLAKDPMDRYADARELLDDINAHLSNAGVSSREDVDQLKAELAQIRSQWHLARNEKDSYQAIISQLNSECKELKKRLGASTGSGAQLPAQNNGEVATLRKTISLINTRLEALRKDNRTLQQKNFALEQTVNKLKKKKSHNTIWLILFALLALGAILWAAASISGRSDINSNSQALTEDTSEPEAYYSETAESAPSI